MATKVNFQSRRKPAKVKLAVLRNEESSLRQIVFLGDCLKRPVREPFFQRTYGCRITAKEFGSKRVYLIQAQLHFNLPPKKCNASLNGLRYINGLSPSKVSCSNASC